MFDLTACEGVCKPKFNERLARDADTPGFLIDRLQQVDGEVYVHTLDFAAGTAGLCEIKVLGQVCAGVMERVELCGRQCFSLRGTALLLSSAPYGPR